jgi:hypothetical protein
VADAVAASPGVAALLAAVSRRLRRERAHAALRSAAWAIVAASGLVAVVHLTLQPLPVALAPALLAGAPLLATLARAAHRPSPLACAHWADIHFDARSTFTTWLEVVTGRLDGSPAAVAWLRSGASRRAPAALELLRAQAPPDWPRTPLLAALTATVAATLVLALPGRDATRPGAQRPAVALVVPAASPAAPDQSAIASSELRPTAAANVAVAPGSAGRATPAAPLAADADAGASPPASATAAPPVDAGGAGGGTGASAAAANESARALTQLLRLAATRRALAPGSTPGTDGGGTFDAAGGDGLPPVSQPSGRSPVAPAHPPRDLALGASGPLELLLIARFSAERGRPP